MPPIHQHAQKKKVIIICGPTASGKTALAIKLAKKYNTSIISADSRQCYRELNIGVAKPSVEELHEVQHYFINSHSITDATVNAKTFYFYALSAVQEIFTTNDIAIMAGGTGLYIKAFCEGLDEMPTIPENIRLAIQQQYQENGLGWLQAEIEIKDPLFWNTTHEKNNPQRLMRALEFIESVGTSITTYKTNETKTRDFEIEKIGIQIERTQLLSNINTRVDNMIAAGLLEEVKTLVPFQQHNALQTVGYKEIFEYLASNVKFSTAIDRIKINTRQYAKRQMTWFQKDAAIRWINPTTDIHL